MLEQMTSLFSSANASFAKTLTESLQLTQPPVAVSFTDRVPEGVKTFAGTAPAGCRFWQEAATQVFATVAQQHDLCSIGMYTHHLEDGPGVQVDLQDALKVFGDLSICAAGGHAVHTGAGASFQRRPRKWWCTDHWRKFR